MRLDGLGRFWGEKVSVGHLANHSVRTVPIFFPINKPLHYRHFWGERQGETLPKSLQNQREKKGNKTAKAVRVVPRGFRWVLSREQVNRDREWIPEERRRQPRRVWGLPNTRLRYWMQTKYNPPEILHPDGLAGWSMSGWLHLMFLSFHYISSLLISDVIGESKLTITPLRLG